MTDEGTPLITRDGPKPPDRVEVVTTRKAVVKKALTVAALFKMLGIQAPPDATSVHILLARSHGNAGSYYSANGGYVVEVRMEWEVPLD